MIWTDKTKIVAQFVYTAHHGQRDKAGVPYIFHLMEVAEKQETERATILALLHDYTEDIVADMSYETVKKHIESTLGLSEDIVKGMWLLKHEKNEPYKNYISRIIESSDTDVIAVKKADIMSNSNPQRLAYLPKETVERLNKKYSVAMNMLLDM